MRQKYIINGIEKSTNELTYSDIKILFTDYVKRKGRYPTQKECTLQNNLPHFRIVAKILADENIMLKDFQTSMGKVGHIRSDISNYDTYVCRFKQKCKEENRTLQISELVNNTEGLPSAKWFVDNCPCNTVKTYNDFVRWCGLVVNSKYDKEYISAKLKELELSLGRTLKRSDITKNNIGFSMIVIKRLWGSLEKAKVEIGLLAEKEDKSLSFEHYKKLIDNTLSFVWVNLHRKQVCWEDFETGEFKVDHHTIQKAFAKRGVDFNSYLKSKGFELSPNSIGNVNYFDDGELTRSKYEWDFSTFLRNELGLKYKNDYNRDIMYKKLSAKINNKINCDYCVHFNGNDYYIEIAGLIYNTSSDNWREITYSSKKIMNYRNKMIEKENIFLQTNAKYLFIFQNDMKSGRYKDMVKDFIQRGDVNNGRNEQKDSCL